jgi:carboxyl-terminal processing protease
MLEFIKRYRLLGWSLSNTRFSFRLIIAVLGGVFLIALAFGSGYVVAAIQSRPLLPPLLWENPVDAASRTGSTLGLFAEAQGLVHRDFYGSLPGNREQIYGAIRGLLAILEDPYTVFVEPIPRQFEQDDLRGSYGGVGMGLHRNELGEVVLTPFRDSPAAQAGIVADDVLLAIDGVQITPEMDISEDLAGRIRGAVGSEVTLTIRRGETSVDFVVIRQVIEVPSVDWRFLENAPTLGYIQIRSFTDRTPEELAQALDELQEGAAQGLILDLRNNGGGLLQSSIDVADEFLDGGAILFERRGRNGETPYLASAGGRASDTPLVVLVNHGTASASEIVAGAIQDRERGTLIGEVTFGKGSVQLIFDLSDGSSLHVTAARWYTPDRHLLDGVGLTPDILVEADPNNGTDPQLERALGFLETGN